MSDTKTEVTTGYLVKNSNRYKRLINTLKKETQISVSGITNFVVGHESPYLVNTILKQTFKIDQLFNGTTNIDAIELQQGRPGRGASVHYLDELIYGTYQMKEENGQQVPDLNPDTGTVKRKQNGFANRAGLAIAGECEDNLIIIRNIDYTLDFCKSEKPGLVETRALMILDRFRDPAQSNGCRLILVTNKPLQLPFKVNTVDMCRVGNFEVRHALNAYLTEFRESGFKISITPQQTEQVVRKLTGMNYHETCDTLSYVLSRSPSKDVPRQIDMEIALRKMRKKVNKDFMDGGFGLTQLVPRPWEDYICPEASNFTFDVKKLLRDFKEIEKLTESQKVHKAANKHDKCLEIDRIIEDIRSRMPHVIILYGLGGVGKSAFPVHLAGLLDMDLWDFNINSTHSKWIGQGSEQMRESLTKINQASHVIVRIDEYDRAIGSTNERGGGMHEAHKQVESEFMNWLQNSQEDDLFVKQNIFVIMTTNHVKNITGPMLRSGRADLVIDIGSFDASSMKETFVSCARRMHNRGVRVLGFKDPDALQEAINDLDLDQLSELATVKRFTVRDVEMLIKEMGSHRYYFNLYGDKKGIPWTTAAFVKVLEKSEGSVKDGSTGELILGDRFYNDEDPEDVQVEFGEVHDLDKLTEMSFDED